MLCRWFQLVSSTYEPLRGKWWQTHGSWWFTRIQVFVHHGGMNHNFPGMCQNRLQQKGEPGEDFLDDYPPVPPFFWGGFLFQKSLAIPNPQGWSISPAGWASPWPRESARLGDQPREEKIPRNLVDRGQRHKLILNQWLLAKKSHWTKQMFKQWMLGGASTWPSSAVAVRFSGFKFAIWFICLRVLRCFKCVTHGFLVPWWCRCGPSGRAEAVKSNGGIISALGGSYPIWMGDWHHVL